MIGLLQLMFLVGTHDKLELLDTPQSDKRTSAAN